MHPDFALLVPPQSKIPPPLVRAAKSPPGLSFLTPEGIEFHEDTATTDTVAHHVSRLRREDELPVRKSALDTPWRWWRIGDERRKRAVVMDADSGNRSCVF